MDSFYNQRDFINNQLSGTRNLINRNFNDFITALAEREKNARQSATQSTELLNQQLGNTLSDLARQRTAGGEQIRNNLSDVERKNRISARAAGGGASSGYMEMQNRANRQASQQFAGLEGQLTSTANKNRLSTQEQINSVNNQLNSTIAQIEADRTASRREKDAAILAAEQQAAQQMFELDRMAQAQSAAGGFAGDLSNFFNGGGARGANVLGATDDVLKNLNINTVDKALPVSVAQQLNSLAPEDRNVVANDLLNALRMNPNVSDFELQNMFNQSVGMIKPQKDPNSIQSRLERLFAPRQNNQQGGGVQGPISGTRSLINQIF